jgi:hypothetical protein
MTGMAHIGRERRRTRRAAVLAVLCAAAAGCSGRPLPSAGTGDAAVAAGDAAVGAGDAAVDAGDAASDAASLPCQLPDRTPELALCGGVPGATLSYASVFTQIWARDTKVVRFEVMGPEGLWASMWGGGGWTVDEPNPLSGWLLWPRGVLPGAGLWLCGQTGTITLHPNSDIDVTLAGLALVPACTGAGGPESIQVDLQGGIIPFQNGGGCLIGFAANGTRNEILTTACPEVGVSFPLDGLRMIERGASSNATACIGNGATLTIVPDPSSTAQHMLIDIPSLSEPEVCGPSAGGEVLMRVRENFVNAGG